jgi:hypothetical protein
MDLISQVREFCRVCDVVVGLKIIILGRMLTKPVGSVLALLPRTVKREM